MYYYFGCNHPSAIKINGIYYGTLGEDVKCLRIEEDFKPFVEICPLNAYGKSANFILEQKFLQNPPENFIVTDLKGGYFIKLLQLLPSENFSIISQEKFSNAIATVFNENGLKISIETQNDFFAETLRFSANSAQITAFNLQNEYFIGIFLTGNENLLCVYHINEKIKKVFMREVFSFSTDSALTTTEKFLDIANHTVTSTWAFNSGCFNRKEMSCKKCDNFNEENLSEKVLPFAFFEEVLAGGDYENFLCNDMCQNACKLKGFLGDFIGIIPPPKFRDINEVGLIYKKSENKYFAEYFSIELQNRKVTNIKKAD